jgi:hypothetical protein
MRSPKLGCPDERFARKALVSTLVVEAGARRPVLMIALRAIHKPAEAIGLGTCLCSEGTLA